MVFGVILAGGVSRRFGDNKLLIEIDGTRVIDRVYNVLRDLVDGVYISIRNSNQEKIFSKYASFTGDDKFLGFVYDVVGDGGPYVALISVVKAIDGEIIVLPGDMPWIDGDVLDKIIRISRDAGATVSSPLWGNGLLESLIIYYNKLGCIECHNLLWELRRHGRPTDFHRISARTLLVPVHLLTESPEVFAHINYKADLSGPRLTNPVRGFFGKPILLERLSPAESYLVKALECISSKKYLEAIEYLYRELNEYLRLRLLHLVEHVVLDMRKTISIFKDHWKAFG